MEYLLGNHGDLSSDLHAKAGRGQTLATPGQVERRQAILETTDQPACPNQWAPGSQREPVTKQIRQNNKEKRGGEWERKMLDTDLWPLTSHCTSGEHICIYVLTHTAPASAHTRTHIQSPHLYICAHNEDPHICTYMHTHTSPTYVCAHTYGFPTLNFTFVFFKKIFYLFYYSIYVFLCI